MSDQPTPISASDFRASLAGILLRVQYYGSHYKILARDSRSARAYVVPEKMYNDALLYREMMALERREAREDGADGEN